MVLVATLPYRLKAVGHANCISPPIHTAHVTETCGNQVISQAPDQEVGFSIAQGSLLSFSLNT
jgi:hypothetical protein